MGGHILVVDDEKEIADVLELYLVNDGYRVHKFYTGMEALDCIENTELDLAILDVMLPDMDGFRICREIREKSFYPVIMLTARTADSDKIMAHIGRLREKLKEPAGKPGFIKTVWGVGYTIEK
ncbi:MAG: response regulator [Acetatifactor sp.]|nr:response regulator [Acetatifactor sp.]